MTFNLESLLPAIAGAISTVALVFINNRVQLNKSKADTVAASANAASVTAKSEAEVFQSKFNLLIASLEKRVANSEARAEELEKQCDELRNELSNCLKRRSRDRHDMDLK